MESEHAQKSHGCHGTQGRKQQHSRVTASPPRWSTTRPLRLPDARIKLRWIGPAHIKGSPVTSARLKISPFREVVIDGSSTDGSAVRAVAVSTVAASLSSTHVDTGVRMNGFYRLVCVRALVVIVRMSFRMRSWIARSTLASSSLASARLEATPRQRAWRTTAFCISAASGAFLGERRFVAKMPRRKNAGSFTSSSLRCVSLETASSLGSPILGVTR